MAGMLPGVESARRRRFHKTNSNQPSPITTPGTSTRRSSNYMVYIHIYDEQQRNPIRQETILCDESRLGTAAREAKKRLDERLQPPWRSHINRTSLENRTTIQSDLQPEVSKLNRSGSKRLSWLKLSWKSSEQDECAVCLEQLKAGLGGTLMQLTCGHRFHTNCLVPWLEANAHCPCCRQEIPS
ncbi:hypothetical protein DH2020_014292 [Rehmannia glutinosa]|uniref:RING-type domain-containing protein n=1 Tax=Rehmannia glutinosa TaxID=99300 RepID=A0ABR0WW23_REHGL